MTDHEQLIDTYLQAYGEPDEPRRAELIAAAFAAGAKLADPPFEAAGHAELSGAFAAVQAQFPQHRFTRTSVVDQHHDVARYTWSLNGPDGDAAVSGTDFVRFDGDGKIAAVTGFFGDVQPSV